jgi:putative addiction module antidote
MAGAAMKLKLKRIGRATGVVLPDDVLVRLDVRPGDSLHLVEDAEGGFRLSRHEPDSDEAMEIARRGMRTYQGALRELAK